MIPGTASRLTSARPVFSGAAEGRGSAALLLSAGAVFSLAAVSSRLPSAFRQQVRPGKGSRSTTLSPSSLISM